MSPWTQPTVHWHPPVDSVAYQRRLAATGELFTTWPAAPFETNPTDCFSVGDSYWIWQIGVGGIQFSADEAVIRAFPTAGFDHQAFATLIDRSWVPAVYALWGRQVVHATAVEGPADGDVVAFTVPTQAGKSTIAYGHGRQHGL